MKRVQSKHLTAPSGSSGPLIESGGMDGVYPVKIGESLRSGGSQYHILRYNFEPESMDKTRGACHVSRSTGQVQIKFGDRDKNEEHIYDGNLLSQREGDYVLVFNPKEATYYLEKVRYHCTLRHVKKGSLKDPATRLLAISPKAPKTKIVTQSTNTKQMDILDEELDRELGMLEEL